MALFGNTDVDFYGQWGAGLFGGGAGTFQPWQAQRSPYVGFSSFAPSAPLPATAAGFLRQQVPELAGMSNLTGRLGGDVLSSYSAFLGGENPYDPTAQRQFASGLLAREDIQGLLRRGELEAEAPIVEGAQGAQSLADVVSRLMGEEGSALGQLYGSFGAEAATQDIQNLLTGQQSAIGGLESIRQFGGTAAAGRQLADPMRHALAAQLLGDTGPIDIGGGQAFNPYSAGILSDEIQLGGLDLSGAEMLEFGTGMLATQNLDITQDIGQYYARAGELGGPMLGKGAYGGQYGGALLSRFAQLGGALGEGQAVTQEGQLSKFIDDLYAGRLSKGSARALNPMGWVQQYAPGIV